MKPVISYIVPVFNRAEDLCVCVESILRGGEGTDIEIILVNDASTDETPVVCDKLAEEHTAISVIHQLENGGVGAAREAGVSASSGEYIFFVDSDDQIDPKAMQELLKKREAWQGVDMVAFNYVVEYGHSNIPTTIFSPEGKTTVDELLEHLHEYRPINVWSYLFNRAFLLRNNIRMPHLNSSEDMIFVAQAVLWAKSMYIFPKYIYRYRDASCNTGATLTKNVTYAKQVQALNAVQTFVIPAINGCDYTTEKQHMIERFVRLRCMEIISKSTIEEFHQICLSDIHQDKLDQVLALYGAEAAAAFYWNTVWDALVKKSDNFRTPVFMCPAGESAIGLAAKILARGGRIDGFLDNGRKAPVSFQRYHQTFSDRPVYPFEQLVQAPTKQKPCIILFSVVDAAESIRQQLAGLGFYIGEDVICP